MSKRQDFENRLRAASENADSFTDRWAARIVASRFSWAVPVALVAAGFVLRGCVGV